MYLEKIVETDPYLVSNRGTVERTVRIIGEGADLSHEKLASAALDFSRSVRSKPGSTFILVLAMGASEFYGPNRNGDAFLESELKKHYKTFETNAHVFKSHVNKDPAKSIGRVEKAFYNDEMHRVELILELFDSKCPEVVSKIRDNQDVAVSMGCRIKYDVCTICGNKAATRADYCKHLKYEMNEIYPDGRIVAAENPSPNFFDISVVFRPADKTGYMMKKVANFRDRPKGSPSTAIQLKVAALTRVSKYLDKAAEIDKIITGIGVNPDSVLSRPEKDLSIKWLRSLAPSMISSHNRLKDSDISDLSGFPMSKVLNGLSSKGIVLMTPEFLDLVFYKLMGCMAPEGLAGKLSKLQSSLFSTLSDNPEVAAAPIEENAISESNLPDSSLEKKVASLSRSEQYSPEYSRPRYLTQDHVKVAGCAAKLYSTYIVNYLSSCEPSTVKLSHVSDPDFHDPTISGNKLAYLLSRSTDIYSSHLNNGPATTIKVSSNYTELPLDDYSLGAIILSV
jgi:hypothetical protein